MEAASHAFGRGYSVQQETAPKKMDKHPSICEQAKQIYKIKKLLPNESSFSI
jgi:hypothetical protein